MRPRRPTLAIALALLAGCGTPGAAGLSAANRPSGGLGTSAADLAGVSVAFNDTYGETMADNEPRARASATNTDKIFLDIVGRARQTLDGAFYDIADPDAVAALIAAQRRGVQVRLVTDTDNMVEKGDPSRPRQAIVDLMAAGVAIRDDRRSAIMHHKFLIADGRTVWMGSTNLTSTSLFAHNNNAIAIESKALADRFGREFSKLFEQGVFGPVKGLLDGLFNPVYKVGGARIQAFFSPRGGGKGAVVDEVARARKSIQFMTFSLTDKELGATVTSRHQAGVKVSGVFDRWLAAGRYSLYLPFKAAGIPVLRDGNEALMHHKVIVIDGETVITGSFNYSQNAEMANNEAFVIVRSQALAKLYEAEFARVYRAAEHNRPPATKPSFANEVPPDADAP